MTDFNKYGVSRLQSIIFAFSLGLALSLLVGCGEFEAQQTQSLDGATVTGNGSELGSPLGPGQPLTPEVGAPEVPPASPPPQPSAAEKKTAALEAEWAKAKPEMKEYINAWGSKAYTLYNAQIYIASFVQEAVTRNRHDWLLDLMEVYMTAQPKLTRVNKYLYYFPNTPSASPRQGERSLGRTMSLWLDPPTSGFTVGQESFLVSTQFLYPVTLLIAAAARDPKLASDTRAKNFVNAFLSVALHDHYRRWIFNRDAPMGVFQVQGWGCNSGHFSHAQRVAHLYSRRFGTSYFSPYRNLGYCNSLWDVDLWIIAGVTHLLYARELRPDWFSSLSASEANALRTHVANGVELFASRLSVGTRKNRQGQNREVVYYEIGGMRGHPDYAYSGDTNPSFPGWTRQGSPAQRPPKEDPNASNDLSHSRRVVRFLFSLDKFGIPLGIVNPAWLIRVHQGMANQLAYGVFNGSFSNPLFTNFLNGTNGWYRVNYSNRENFGYEPWSWSQGRSTLTGGYYSWSRYNADLVPIAIAAAKKETYPSVFDRLQIYSALPSDFW